MKILACGTISWSMSKPSEGGVSWIVTHGGSDQVFKGKAKTRKQALGQILTTIAEIVSEANNL